MIRHSVGGTIGSSDGTTFSGDFFQRLAFFARPINKPPYLSRAVFATLKIHCSLGEKESVLLPIGILFLFIEVFFLSEQEFQGAYMA
jgi:hypothetical protein